jgi:hypothetical protein
LFADVDEEDHVGGAEDSDEEDEDELGLGDLDDI